MPAGLFRWLPCRRLFVVPPAAEATQPPTGQPVSRSNQVSRAKRQRRTPSQGNVNLLEGSLSVLLFPATAAQALVVAQMSWSCWKSWR